MITISLELAVYLIMGILAMPSIIGLIKTLID